MSHISQYEPFDVRWEKNRPLDIASISNPPRVI